MFESTFVENSDAKRREVHYGTRRGFTATREGACPPAAQTVAMHGKEHGRDGKAHPGNGAEAVGAGLVCRAWANSDGEGLETSLLESDFSYTKLQQLRLAFSMFRPDT